MGTTTARLPESIEKGLEEVSREEQLDKSTVIRRLLAKSLEEWRIQYALNKYKQRKFSFEQAAHYAQVSVWKFNDLLIKHKIPFNYDMEELHRDLKTLKKWKQ